MVLALGGIFLTPVADFKVGQHWSALDDSLQHGLGEKRQSVVGRVCNENKTGSSERIALDIFSYGVLRVQRLGGDHEFRGTSSM